MGVQREDLRLQFFEIAGFDPEQSYGSCLVLTADIEGLHRAFAAGMRAAYGKVLVSGTPRMTRPRARKNVDGLGGFSVIDPGGNWIRVFRDAATAPMPAATPAGRLAKTLANAVVQADPGKRRAAVRILDSALALPQAETTGRAGEVWLPRRTRDGRRSKDGGGDLARAQSVTLTEDNRKGRHLVRQRRHLAEQCGNNQTNTTLMRRLQGLVTLKGSPLVGGHVLNGVGPVGPDGSTWLRGYASFESHTKSATAAAFCAAADHGRPVADLHSACVVSRSLPDDPKRDLPCVRLAHPACFMATWRSSSGRGVDDAARTAQQANGEIIARTLPCGPSATIPLVAPQVDQSCDRGGSCHEVAIRSSDRLVGTTVTAALPPRGGDQPGAAGEAGFGNVCGGQHEPLDRPGGPGTTAPTPPPEWPSSVGV